MGSGVCGKSSDTMAKNSVHAVYEDEDARRESADAWRDAQLAAILKSRYSMMNTVDLKSGQCERLGLNKASGLEKTLIGDYHYYIQQALSRFVHPEDAEKCREVLSLEHLREKAETGEDGLMETCRYRTREEPVRWIEQQVIYVRQKDKATVHILGRDITGEKRREEERLQTLEDRAYIISSMSSLFFSTYYVNVENDTFRTVAQLSRVGDVLGSEVNCTAALRIYAENFVHPDDREKYLEVMNIQNWVENLRWWHPSVAIEYRKMPEETDNGEKDCEWIRATAILARIGTDDMPKTVIYVAQNITEGKWT